MKKIILSNSSGKVKENYTIEITYWPTSSVKVWWKEYYYGIRTAGIKEDVKVLIDKVKKEIKTDFERIISKNWDD